MLISADDAKIAIFVIGTQVFEHVARPVLAIGLIARMLRPAGLLFWSAPFNERFHLVHGDFYRYTVLGARTLLEDARGRGSSRRAHAALGQLDDLLRLPAWIWRGRLHAAVPREAHVGGGGRHQRQVA